ncbi:MAG: hypothetical protein ACOC0P_05370 [Planctomycetota bacterium]
MPVHIFRSNLLFRFGSAADLRWHRSGACPGLHARVSVMVLLLLLLTALSSGCSSTSDETAVRTAFLEHDRVAIIANLPRQHEEFFIPYYMNAFPSQMLVERRDVVQVIDEQDLLPERLNEETRARLREILGVRAVVYPSASSGQFAIKVVDTETAEITASTIVSGRNLWSDDALDDRRLIRQGINAIRDRADSLRSIRIRPPN